MADQENRPDPLDRPTQRQPAQPGAADPTQRFDPDQLPPAADPYVDDTSVLPGYPADSQPRPDQTRAGDPAAAAGAAAPGGAVAGERWAGRAGVPPAGTRAPAPVEVGWEQYPPQRGGRWWTPIVIGLIFLLFLALLGLGLWLALRHQDNPTPAPGPTATVSASPLPSPTPSPTGPASPSPSPAMVILPDLTGVSAADASAVLTNLGLVARIQQQTSDTAPAGTVIDTDPRANTAVPVGSTVTLFVAVPPSPSPSQSVSPSPSQSG